MSDLKGQISGKGLEKRKILFLRNPFRKGILKKHLNFQFGKLGRHPTLAQDYTFSWIQLCALGIFFLLIFIISKCGKMDYMLFKYPSNSRIYNLHNVSNKMSWNQ